MEQIRFDHVALLVADLERAVRDWTEILNVLDPAATRRVVRYENFGEGEGQNNWATFQSPDQTSIQLFEPAADEGFLRRRLDGAGEGVHHIAFLSTDLEATVERLRDAGIPFTRDAYESDKVQIPWQRWMMVHPKKTHGTLIEIAQAYEVTDDLRWAPDHGEAGS